jgi:hypothetical protein
VTIITASSSPPGHDPTNAVRSSTSRRRRRRRSGVLPVDFVDADPDVDFVDADPEPACSATSRTRRFARAAGRRATPVLDLACAAPVDRNYDGCKHLVVGRALHETQDPRVHLQLRQEGELEHHETQPARCELAGEQCSQPPRRASRVAVVLVAANADESPRAWAILGGARRRREW